MREHIEREQIETDVLIVGGGPAGLACALRLTQLIASDHAAGRKPALSPDGILLLEKGADMGAHILSGAVMDPRALAELIPDFIAQGAPIECAVEQEAIYFLTEASDFRLPVVPPFLKNNGNLIISLGKLVQWLGERAEAAGVSLLTSTAGANLIIEAGQVRGVITDDKGLDREGRAGENDQPGYELRARVTVLAEGARGSLSGRLIDTFKLAAESNPQAYGLGVKEVWEIPTGRIAPGTVWHTFGYPLPTDMQGGGWLYAMSENRVSLGLIAGMQDSAPGFDAHSALQSYKQHPLIRRLLEGGQLVKYGARTLTKGGYWSLPKLHAPGALLVGDAAGFLDSLRLKGVHMAIKSGMLAADTIYQAMSRDDLSDASLSTYRERFDSSWMKDDLWRARNHQQGYEHGLLPGIMHTLLQAVTGGRGLRTRYSSKAVSVSPQTVRPALPAAIVHDGMISFDKLASVYYSGTGHREDQPGHLRIRDAETCLQCSTTFGNPCQYFCPAGVYEMVETTQGKRLKINAANCLHCKACDIMDPYRNIDWTPPEGGGGPRHEGM